MLLTWSAYDADDAAEQNGKLYIPVQDNVRSSAPAASAQIDSMQLDDTKDKVYIHNLDAELADLESDEETPVFLPDVEKKLSKIPRSVLTGRSPPITSTQLILYNVPSSLSVPEEQDSVRRAIIESRARTRAKQAQQQKAGEEHNLVTGNLGNGIRHDSDKDGTANDEDMEVDENAMEIG
ncbi:MAG: hypothetical protein LQ338_007325 [Usnochroma carphineum]|nr:MAG: hypothetical protein LQ338_007325 [Usnochroma carphineum]